MTVTMLKILNTMPKSLISKIIIPEDHQKYHQRKFPMGSDRF